jgi:hypothetical protein
LFIRPSGGLTVQAAAAQFRQYCRENRFFIGLHADWQPSGFGRLFALLKWRYRPIAVLGRSCTDVRYATKSCRMQRWFHAVSTCSRIGSKSLAVSLDELVLMPLG